MNRRTGSVLGGLLALALLAGCSSANDKPDTGVGTSTTEVSSTSTTSGPFGGGPATSTTGATPDTTEGAGSDPGAGSGVGTGSGPSDASSPVDAGTPQELSDALGSDCADFADVGGAVQQPGTAAEGTCEFGGEIVNLYTFADAAAQRDFVENGSFFDCSFITAFGGGGATYYVSGNGWIARPGTEEVARGLAAALDGEVATYTCESGN